MIEGFKVKVSSSELRTHLKGRSAYHKQRAEDKSAKLPGLKEAMEHLKNATSLPATNVSNMGKGGYHSDPDDPVRDLERDIADHRNKSLVFSWFSEHLFEEDYILFESDLIRLEILKGR